MKTKSLLVLSLVGAAAVVGVGVVGVSGIAINSNVAATSGKNMVFDKSSNKPTITGGAELSASPVTYTATTLASGSFETGTAGVDVVIGSPYSTTGGTYYPADAYWLCVHPINNSGTYTAHFWVKWKISAVISNAYINYLAVSSQTITQSVKWIFTDTAGTSHSIAITSGTAFTSQNTKPGAASYYEFNFSASIDFAVAIESASFSWSC
jgi:hypothetical protein